MSRMRPRSHPVKGGWLTGVPRAGSVIPSGYCGDHADSPHASATEAYACWRGYLVEKTLRLDSGGISGECLYPECMTFTDRCAVINNYPRPFCDEHRNAGHVAEWWNAATAKMLADAAAATGAPAA